MDAAAEHLAKSGKTDLPLRIYNMPKTASHQLFVSHLPISKTACVKAASASTIPRSTHMWIGTHRMWQRSLAKAVRQGIEVQDYAVGEPHQGCCKFFQTTIRAPSSTKLSWNASQAWLSILIMLHQDRTDLLSSLWCRLSLRAPDAPQNVRFCRNPRKINFQKNARKKEIGKIIFLYFPKIGRIRTNSDEIQKIKPLFSAV